MQSVSFAFGIRSTSAQLRGVILEQTDNAIAEGSLSIRQGCCQWPKLSEEREQSIGFRSPQVREFRYIDVDADLERKISETSRFDRSIT